jgi:hypothetical protein
MLLCVAADRVLKKPNGEIELNIKPDQLNHTNLKNSGVYRKFLENVDNIQASPLPFK